MSRLARWVEGVATAIAAIVVALVLTAAVAWWLTRTGVMVP